MKSLNILTKSLTFTLTAAVLAFTSCKKENETKKPDEPTPHQLIKFEESATTYTTFNYNAAGLITRIATVDDGQQEAFDITYNTNNRPQQAKSGDRSIKFTYTGNLLDQALLFNGPVEDSMSGYVKLNYNGNKATEAVMYMNLDATSLQPLSKFTYEYNANGDVKKKTHFAWNAYTQAYIQGESIVYEYDTRNNPFNTLTELYQAAFEMPSIHNVVKETTYDEENQITNITTYTYAYNNAGFPTQAEKKSAALGQANPDVSHLKYSYK